jgi:hypothetical protein
LAIPHLRILPEAPVRILLHELEDLTLVVKAVVMVVVMTEVMVAVGVAAMAAW